MEREGLGSGTVLRLTVRPLVAGELPVIFAGPGGSTATAATVVALPARRRVAAEQP